MTNIVKRQNGVRNRLSPILDEFFNSPFLSMPQQSWPRVDIHSTEDNVTLDFELPGMSKDDIHVTIENNMLNVSGERRSEYDETDDGWVRREIAEGSFQRQFTLPTSVDPDSIKAEYKDGILRVKLDKKEEAKPKQIDVKVS